jgi:PAS domain S-box-containing protein
MTIDDIEQKAMLAAIIDSSEDAIISKTLDGVITSWNKAAEGLFGYKAEEVIGKHISILIPEARLAEEQMIISSLRSESGLSTIRLTKSDAEVHISLTISPIKNIKGSSIDIESPVEPAI